MAKGTASSSPSTPAVRDRSGRPRFGRIILFLAAAGLFFVIHKLLEPQTAHFLTRRGVLETVTTVEQSKSNGYIEEQMTLVSSSGLTVDLSIKAPDGAVRKRPLLVLLGGHETGQDAVLLVEDTRGAVVAAISYPYTGDHGVKGFAVITAVPVIQDAIRDTPPAVMLALDYLLRRPDIDPQRVELVGVSLGAPFACIVGGLDPRFRRVWAIHGAALPYRMMEHNLRHRIGVSSIRIGVAKLGALLGFGATMAPEHWVGRIAPRTFVMVNGENDEKLPRDCILALYEAASEPKELIWIPGKHVEPNRPEIVRSLVDVVFDRMADDGLL